jgi:hypothetical protein
MERWLGLLIAVLLLTGCFELCGHLEILLTVRRIAPGVPVVARLASFELSSHIGERRHARTACSVAIASVRFAEIALTLGR